MRTQLVRLFLFAFLAPLLAITSAHGHPLPGPYKATYAATYNGMEVQASRELTKNNDGYHLVTTLKGMLGGMTEQEGFQIDKKGHIHPNSYHADRSIFGVKKTEKMIVDQVNNIAIYTRKKKHRELDMKPDYLGPVSYELQLRHDLQALALLPEGMVGPDSSFTYKVLSRGKVKDYEFKILGKEVVDTALGAIPTTKVERVRDGGKRKTTFWMAPEWYFLIVKIHQQEKDGEQYEMLLETASIGGKAVSLSATTSNTNSSTKPSTKSSTEPSKK